MYRIVIVSLLALIMALPHTAAAQQGARMAVVDVERLLDESLAAQSLQKQLEAKRDAFQQEFSQKEKALQSLEKEIVAQKDSLSADAFAKRRKDYETQIMETRRLYQKRRSGLDVGLSKAMAQLRRHIVEATAKIAETQNYDMIVSRESVILVDKSLDISDAVLKELDASVTTIPLTVE